MTRVEFIKRGNAYAGFEAHGHTGYAQSGEDIVCSAVSALTQTTLIGIIQTVGAEAEYCIEDGGIRCMLTEENAEKREKCELLIRVMYEGLCNIEKNYGKYLSVSEREVT